MPKTDRTIDVRKIPHHERHVAIFKTYDALSLNEGIILINDHDPAPLQYQMKTLLGRDAFSWEYQENGPNVWKVRICKTS